LLDWGANEIAVYTNGWTALHSAAAKGRDSIVRLLLSKGVDAFRLAPQNGHLAVVKEFLDIPATRLDVLDQFKQSPLFKVDYSVFGYLQHPLPCSFIVRL